jgi:hypothetical protein
MWNYSKSRFKEGTPQFDFPYQKRLQRLDVSNEQQKERPDAVLICQS